MQRINNSDSTGDLKSLWELLVTTIILGGAIPAGRWVVEGSLITRILQVLCGDTISTIQHSLLQITFLLQQTFFACTLSRSALILFFWHLNDFSWEEGETVIAILSVCFLRPCHIPSTYPSCCFPSFQNFRQHLDRSGVAWGGLS